MNTTDSNIKFHSYNDGRVRCLRFTAGNEQAAIAEAEGFAWCGSTNTHDIFLNRKYAVKRFINKETKNFYESRVEE